MAANSEAPLASQTADDHRAQLWIACLICLCFVAITVSLRVHVRWRMFGMDDGAILAASAAAFVQFIVVMLGLSHGLGASTDEAERSSTEWIGRVGLVFFNTAPLTPTD